MLVTTQALPKGMLLGPEHLTLKAINLDQLNRGYFTTLEQITDFVLKRAVNQNTVLSPQQVSPPVLIRKDDTVIILAGDPETVEVRVNGLALQDGRLNQQIRIKNIASGKQIKARVIGRGIVRADY